MSNTLSATLFNKKYNLFLRFIFQLFPFSFETGAFNKYQLLAIAITPRIYQFIVLFYHTPIFGTLSDFFAL